MEEALLGRAVPRGSKHDFHGERRHPGERVDVEEQAVVDAVELDGSAAGGIDDLRAAFDGNGVAAYRVRLSRRQVTGPPSAAQTAGETRLVTSASTLSSGGVGVRPGVLIPQPTVP